MNEIRFLFFGCCWMVLLMACGGKTDAKPEATQEPECTPGYTYTFNRVANSQQPAPSPIALSVEDVELAGFADAGTIDYVDEMHKHCRELQFYPRTRCSEDGKVYDLASLSVRCADLERQRQEHLSERLERQMFKLEKRRRRF